MKLLGFEIPFTRSSGSSGGVNIPTSGTTFSLSDTDRFLRALGVRLDEIVVSPITAFSIASYYGSVRVIADMLASQPFILYEGDNKKRTTAKEHPLYSLLNVRPHPQQSSFVFRRTMMTNALTYGFAIARIIKDQFGRPMEFKALDSAKVLIYQTLDEEIYFTYQNGSQKSSFFMLHESEFIHLKAMDFGGLTGYAPSGYQHQTIKVSLSSREFVDSYYGKSTFMGGILTAPNKIDEESAKKIKSNFKESNKPGVQNSGDVAVLSGGLTYQAIGRTPVESQMVEFFNKCDSDIYKVLGVPPFMLGDVTSSTSWGSGIEQQFIGFVNVTLMPWIRQFEEEINYKCLRADEVGTYFSKIDLNDLLQGDIKTRMEYIRTMIQNGVINQNEARTMEHLDEVEDGNRRWIQQNMMPMDKAEEILLSKNKPQTDVKATSDN